VKSILSKTIQEDFMKRLASVLLLAALFGITVFLAQANVIGGTEEQLRELIDYMFGENVTVAALPADFPLNFELPIPANTHIVASMVYEHQNGVEASQSQMLNIILRSETILPSEIAEFYQGYFLEMGWQELNLQFEEATGFYGSNTISASYCYQRDHYFYYSLWKSANADETTIDWSINIVTNPSESECQVVDNDYRQLRDFFPQFETIEGVELLGYSSLGTIQYPDIFASYVTGMRLSIPMEEVFEAYNQQLRDANWQYQSSEMSETFAISDWRIDTEELGLLYGRLVILQKTVNSSEYTAYLSLEIR
jgi:hypothetical protein